MYHINQCLHELERSFNTRHVYWFRWITVLPSHPIFLPPLPQSLTNRTRSAWRTLPQGVSGGTTCRRRIPLSSLASVQVVGPCELPYDVGGRACVRCTRGGLAAVALGKRGERWGQSLGMCFRSGGCSRRHGEIRGQRQKGAMVGGSQWGKLTGINPGWQTTDPPACGTVFIRYPLRASCDCHVCCGAWP